MGSFMSGNPNWALIEPSSNCTQLCTMLWGCTTTSIWSMRNVEEPFGLNNFEPFVHHGRAVNGNFGAHVPIGMLQRLCFGDTLPILQRVIARGTVLQRPSEMTFLDRDSELPLPGTGRSRCAPNRQGGCLHQQLVPLAITNSPATTKCLFVGECDGLCRPE